MSNAVSDYAIFWSWLILAAVLAGLETVVPGVFIIWLAGAAAAVSVLTLALDIGWELQLVAFATLAVISVLFGRAYLRHNPIASDAPQLNRRSEQLVGRVVTAAEDFRGGQGRVILADSRWLASGPNVSAGAQVRIVAVEGTRLVVEAA